MRHRLREASRLAFQRLVDLAISERVDAVLIAGDLFDDERLSFQTERFLLEQLNRLDQEGIPVIYATGNHDPGRAGLRSADLPWPGNVTVARDRTAVRIAVRASDTTTGDGELRGVVTAAGAIVTTDGNEIGRHDGVTDYTVGQRRGLGLGGGQRQFVTAIDTELNRVIVGGEHELARETLSASDPFWVGKTPTVGETVQARIRYHATALPASVTALSSDGFVLDFDSPARAVAPGQAAVLYHGDEVIGGGTIEAATAAPQVQANEAGSAGV